MTEKKPMSLLGIIALICALLCFTFPVAIVLAIIDLTKNKDDGKNKILSIIALCVSGLWLVIGVINSGKNKNEVSEPSVWCHLRQPYRVWRSFAGGDRC